MCGRTESSAYYAVTSYAVRISGTSWRLINAPADGSLAKVVTAAGLLEGGPLYLAPSERCIILPLIEIVSPSAEYTGTLFNVQAAIRQRISEAI